MQVQGSFEGREGWVRENVRGGEIGLESVECSEDGVLEKQGGWVVGRGREVGWDGASTRGKSGVTVYRSCLGKGRVDKNGGIPV